MFTGFLNILSSVKLLSCRCHIDGITYSYQGNYSKYLDQRRARLEIWKEQYEKQLRYIKEEENWIKKAKNDPSMSSQVKSRESSLEKFKQSDEIIPQPPKSKKFRFRYNNVIILLLYSFMRCFRLITGFLLLRGVVQMSLK